MTMIKSIMIISLSLITCLVLSNISLTLVLITYQHLLDNNSDNCLLLLYVNLLMSHLVILQTKYDINWII
jgi:hypothetical protein